jgi:Tol biopolymer transport system component/DNA-binding winged helix-turn-helix (wHTH) protein
MIETKDRVFYEFGAFRLDAAEKSLWRSTELIALTPKAFDTLLVLVRHQGRVVEKETLLSEVWPDTFVEEATLAQNVFTLRKALGADENGSQFIETIPRRGYRFAAPVREFNAGADVLLIEQHTRTQIVAEETSESPDKAARQTDRKRTLSGKLLLGVAASAAVLCLAGWLVWQRTGLFRSQKKFAVAFKEIELAKLTDNGQTRKFALSGDGKYLAYAVADGAKQSLLLRQVSAVNSVVIVPSAEVIYNGVTFSPDSSQVFYVSREKGASEGVLYQIAVLGGAPNQVLRDVDSPVTLSPDGKRFAFVRQLPDSRESALMIGNVNGGEPQTLVKRPWRDRFSLDGPAWSPDGGAIAIGAINLSQTNSHMNVVTVNVKDATLKPLSEKRWSWVGQVAWLGDSSGLMVTAWEENSQIMPDQVWLLSYPEGEGRRVTTGINGYYGLGIANDSGVMVAAQWVRNASFWVTEDITGPAKRITHGSGDTFGARLGLNWTPEGRLIYSTNANGPANIWTMAPDGSDKRPVTASPAVDTQPVATRDGRYIVYVSHGPEGRHIWRIDADGKNPLRLTNGEGDDAPDLSPDGQWVYYTSLFNDRPTLWRVGIDGGPATQLTQFYTAKISVSPDGKTIACNAVNQQARQLKLSLVSAEDGKLLQQFEHSADAYGPSVRWSSDGKSIYFLKVESETGAQIYQQPLGGNPARKITQALDNRIYRFAIAPDGKQWAFEAGRDIDDLILIRDSKTNSK